MSKLGMGRDILSWFSPCSVWLKKNFLVYLGKKSSLNEWLKKKLIEIVNLIKRVVENDFEEKRVLKYRVKCFR